MRGMSSSLGPTHHCSPLERTGALWPPELWFPQSRNPVKREDPMGCFPTLLCSSEDHLSTGTSSRTEPKAGHGQHHANKGPHHQADPSFLGVSWTLYQELPLAPKNSGP